jgi:transposase-like protein
MRWSVSASDQLCQLSVKVWEFRKEFGFSKSLPEEIRIAASELTSSGTSLVSVAKALGVSKGTVSDWKQKYFRKTAASFSEVRVVESKPSYEIKLSAQVQSCRAEITGSDFSLLQRLIRKLSS